MASGKRFDNESYDDYRERLMAEDKYTKSYLKGELIYPNFTSRPSEDKKYDGIPHWMKPLEWIKTPPYRREES